MADPLAPRSKSLPNYVPGSHDFKSPLKRWSSKAQDWVPVEIAKTPLLDKRRETAMLERAALSAAQTVVDEPEEKPAPETPTQHLRPRAPWWRNFLPED